MTSSSFSLSLSLSLSLYLSSFHALLHLILCLNVYPGSPNILVTDKGYLYGSLGVWEIWNYCFRRKDKGCSGFC